MEHRDEVCCLNIIYYRAIMPIDTGSCHREIYNLKAMRLHFLFYGGAQSDTCSIKHFVKKVVSRSGGITLNQLEKENTIIIAIQRKNYFSKIFVQADL